MYNIYFWHLLSRKVHITFISFLGEWLFTRQPPMLFKNMKSEFFTFIGTLISSSRFICWKVNDTYLPLPCIDVFSIHPTQYPTFVYNYTNLHRNIIRFQSFHGLRYTKLNTVTNREFCFFIDEIIAMKEDTSSTMQITIRFDKTITIIF